MMTVTPMDQAAELRRLMAEQETVPSSSDGVPMRRQCRHEDRSNVDALCGTAKNPSWTPERRGASIAARVIALVSSRAGAGRTCLAVNLSMRLSQQGARVLLVEVDDGWSTDAARGYSFGNCAVETIRLPMSVISDAGRRAGPSSISLVDDLSRLEAAVEYIVVDGGAGPTAWVKACASSADELLIVTASDPSGAPDAYGLIKSLSRSGIFAATGVVVNRAASRQDGDLTAARIGSVAERFLGVQVRAMGCVVFDPDVGRATGRRVSFVGQFPLCPATACLSALADGVRVDRTGAPPRGEFFRRLINHFK